MKSFKICLFSLLITSMACVGEDNAYYWDTDTIGGGFNTVTMLDTKEAILVGAYEGDEGLISHVEWSNGWDVQSNLHVEYASRDCSGWTGGQMGDSSQNDYIYIIYACLTASSATKSQIFISKYDHTSDEVVLTRVISHDDIGATPDAGIAFMNDYMAIKMTLKDFEAILVFNTSIELVSQAITAKHEIATIVANNESNIFYAFGARVTGATPFLAKFDHDSLTSEHLLTTSDNILTPLCADVDASGNVVLGFQQLDNNSTPEAYFMTKVDTSFNLTTKELDYTESYSYASCAAGDDLWVMALGNAQKELITFALDKDGNVDDFYLDYTTTGFNVLHSVEVNASDQYIQYASHMINSDADTFPSFFTANLDESGTAFADLGVTSSDSDVIEADIDNTIASSWTISLASFDFEVEDGNQDDELALTELSVNTKDATPNTDDSAANLMLSFISFVVVAFVGM